jgi:hypothetical protein
VASTKGAIILATEGPVLLAAAGRDRRGTAAGIPRIVATAPHADLPAAVRSPRSLGARIRSC